MPRNMIRVLSALSLILLVIDASAEGQREQFTLGCEQLMRTDSSLVLRLTVDAPPSEDAERTRLVFVYGPTIPKEVSHDISHGIRPRGTDKRHAEILLVAQVAAGTDKHPPMLMLSTQQSANGKPGAYTFQAHRLEKDTKLHDVFHIDVEAGSYPLAQQIKIGTLGIDPVFLSVESDEKR